MSLIVFLSVCMVFVSICTIQIGAVPIPNDVEASEELQPRAARAACWDSIDSALNYYLGKNKWDCVDGEYTAEGFEITVEGNKCTVEGNDVSYSFYFGS